MRNLIVGTAKQRKAEGKKKRSMIETEPARPCFTHPLSNANELPDAKKDDANIILKNNKIKFAKHRQKIITFGREKFFSQGANFS